MYIGIAGNIGSGKTTLTHLITNAYGWMPQYEDAANNPYLADFYDNMDRWSFNIQVYFLTQRFRSIQKVLWSETNVVQDRTIYEDAFIFARNLYQIGVMQLRDYNAYLDLFRVMNSFLRPPDLLIYLRASVPTLIKQIQIRNRAYEAQISHRYLEQLNDLYEEWISGYRGEILEINVDNSDFANNEVDQQKTLEIIGRAIGVL